MRLVRGAVPAQAVARLACLPSARKPERTTNGKSNCDMSSRSAKVLLADLCPPVRHRSGENHPTDVPIGQVSRKVGRAINWLAAGRSVCASHPMSYLSSSAKARAREA